VHCYHNKPRGNAHLFQELLHLALSICRELLHVVKIDGAGSKSEEFYLLGAEAEHLTAVAPVVAVAAYHIYWPELFYPAHDTGGLVDDLLLSAMEAVYDGLVAVRQYYTAGTLLVACGSNRQMRFNVAAMIITIAAPGTVLQHCTATRSRPR